MGVFDRLPPMDHLRSEKMCFVQLIIPAESSRVAVTYLGELGLLQFKDVSSPPSLPPLLASLSRLSRSRSDLPDPASGVVISPPTLLARVALCGMLDLARGRARIAVLVFDLRVSLDPSLARVSRSSLFGQL
jgi:hypothetical protein